MVQFNPLGELTGNDPDPETIHVFYDRDYVSRWAPGRTDSVTIWSEDGKEKKQA